MKKNISEKRLMSIKRELQARARKMRMGKERSGAYIFGTLRRIQGNPTMYIQKVSDLENLRKQLDKGMSIQEISKTRNGYRVNLTQLQYPEKEVWGEPYGEYFKRAFPKLRGNPIQTKIERLRQIVNDRQNAVIQGTRVDTYSASAIISVYDKLDPKNQRRYAKMSIPKMANVAFRIITER